MSKAIIFVSLGPGDPELVTLKALRYLQNAEAIYCPATLTKTDKTISRASKILHALEIDTSKINTFEVPMIKARTFTIDDYKSIANNIAKHWEVADKNIVICAQGDASFYSSIYYISEFLSSKKLPIKRVAGVPAFIAAGTLANIHIVKQEEHLRVIPGVVSFNELKAECSHGNTVVIMKTPQSEDTIKQAIREIDELSFHYFENVGVTEKEFYTSNKQTILDRKFPYFSLLIIKQKNI